MKQIRETLTDPEQELVASSDTANTGNRTAARVTTELHVAHLHGKMVDDLIESNEKLAKANTKYAKGLLVLTGGLVFVGVVQIIVQIFGS